MRHRAIESIGKHVQAACCGFLVLRLTAQHCAGELQKLLVRLEELAEVAGAGASALWGLTPHFGLGRATVRNHSRRRVHAPRGLGFPPGATLEALTGSSAFCCRGSAALAP